LCRCLTLANRKYLIAVAVLVIVIILASVGYTVYQQQLQQTANQQWADTLIVGVSGEPFNNPDPNIGYASLDGRVSTLTMCRLWLIDDKNSSLFHPEVADSWNEVTLPDGSLALQIKIHPGLVFQDGTPINATAVGMGLDRIVQVEPSYGWMHPWTKWEAPDLYTLNLIISTPFDALTIVGLLSEGLGGGMFASPSSFQKYPSTGSGDIVGCGPYKFNSAQYVPNEKVVLDRWDGYAFKDRMPSFKSIIFRIFADSATMRLALEKGDIDVADKWLAKSDLLALANDPKFGVDYGKGLGQTRFLFMNQRFAPLNDTRVRKAIAYALDIDAIMNATQSGLAARAYTLDKPYYAYGVPVFQEYPHNVQMAKQLLAQAGYPNGFSTAIYWSDEFDIKEIESNVISLIKQQLAAVGIQLDVRYADWGSWTTYRRQGTVMPMGLAGWLEDWPDIDSFMWPMLCPSFELSCPYGWASGINDTRVNQLLLQGRTLYDPSKPNDPARAAVYSQIQKIMADQVLVIPFWYNSVGEAWRSYVHNFGITWNIFTDDFQGIPSGPAPIKVPEAGSTPTLIAPALLTRKALEISRLAIGG
jgi:peptide/nickel transport system substrate-binding protein